ncbi:hypothetical protein BG844_04625 [Couchioplanes caeruleus subsp. caeruleus]|uniref:Uncharacterized protein n=1 Tax=Couchioplanes caeruleus subsp. caeruleus TaxID=56427 RepID=A0A1K0GSG5_9ACTN|nr:hypothetical protein BG844_04625 [Couchioplanes caeruleus subsp. caeruleus]
MAELVAAVTQEGRRGAFWLPRLRDLQDALGVEDRPAGQILTDAATLEDLLYAAPRDNFADFYLLTVDPQQRAEQNRRFTAAAETLHAALSGRDQDRG